MMKSHPYDTFFDESILSKAGFDLYSFQKEVDASRRVLQKCLDTGKHRHAPTNLSQELFEFSKFTDTMPTPDASPVLMVPDLKSYMIDKKSVQEEEASELAQKENSRLQLYTRVVNSQRNTPSRASRYSRKRERLASQESVRASQEEMLALMMTRARDKSREMEQVGSVDLSYTENALQFTESIK